VVLLRGLRYSNFNSDIDTLFNNDSLIGASLSHISLDIDTLFTNEVLIAVSIDSLDDTVNSLIDVLGISSSNEDAEIGGLYGAFLAVSGYASGIKDTLTIVQDTLSA
jgi:hypothetical protein